MLKGEPVILCATCLVPPQVPQDAVDTDKVICPTCGHSDTVADARQDAVTHGTHEASRQLESSCDKVEFVSYRRTPTRTPTRNLRWISGVVNTRILKAADPFES